MHLLSPLLDLMILHHAISGKDTSFSDRLETQESVGLREIRILAKSHHKKARMRGLVGVADFPGTVTPKWLAWIFFWLA